MLIDPASCRFLIIAAALWVLLSAIALWVGATYDEQAFYLPAVTHALNSAAWLPLDYPLPNPPVGLWMQRGVSAMFGIGLTPLRALSVLAAWALLIAVAFGLRRAHPLAVALVLLTPAMPDAFLIKHHVFALAGIALGFACLESTSRWRGLAPLGFALAVFCSQLAIPALLFACLREYLTLRALTRVGEVFTPGMRRQFTMCAFLSAPLAVLAGLFWHWGGWQPPMYRGELLESGVGAMRVHWEQLTLGLAVLGFWTLPLQTINRRFVQAVVLLAAPAALWVNHLSLFDISETFNGYAIGPVSTLMRGLSLGHAATLDALAGMCVAAGILSLARLVLDRAPGAALVATYLVMMNFVPYLIESYYGYLLFVLYLISPERVEANWRAGLAARTVVTLTVLAGGVHLLGKATHLL